MKVVCNHTCICRHWWGGDQLEVADGSARTSSWLPAADVASRCALISSTRRCTKGWLIFPSVESKNSWCFCGQLSRFSYSNACSTKSKRSRSFTNFDSGVSFSSYSYRGSGQKRIIVKTINAKASSLLTKNNFINRSPRGSISFVIFRIALNSCSFLSSLDTPQYGVMSPTMHSAKSWTNAVRKLKND